MGNDELDVMLPWHWFKGKGTPRCPLCFGAVEDVKALWRSDEDSKRLRFTAFCPYCDETINMYCGPSLQMVAVLTKRQMESYRKAKVRRDKANKHVKNGPSTVRP